MLLILCTQILAITATVTASFEPLRGNRIFGGTNATKDYYPPIVSYSEMSKYIFGRRLEHLCGGTIIHPQWILTAGHCPSDEYDVPLSKLRIRAGFTDLTHGKPLEPGEFNYKIEKFVVHPGFDGNNPNDDVAVVKIKGNFGDRQLAVLDDSDGDLSTGEATALGWGRTEKSGWVLTDFLMKVTDQLCPVELEVIGNNSYVMNTTMSVTPPELAKKQLICFGSGKGRGGCEGDSGGPLIVGPHKIQIGWTSFGNKYKCGKEPSYYQRVSYHIPWIEKTIGAKVKVASELKNCAAVSGPIFLAAFTTIFVKLFN